MNIFYIIGKLGYIDRTIPEPVRVRAGIFLTSHRGSGIVRSMSLSFAFIIPLNYQINVKNNLSVRREKHGPDIFVLTSFTNTAECQTFFNASD